MLDGMRNANFQQSRDAKPLRLFSNGKANTTPQRCELQMEKNNPPMGGLFSPYQISSALKNKRGNHLRLRGRRQGSLVNAKQEGKCEL